MDYLVLIMVGSIVSVFISKVACHRYDFLAAMKLFIDEMWFFMTANYSIINFVKS